MNRKIIVFDDEMERSAIEQNVLPAFSGKVIKYLPLVKAAAVFIDPSTTNEEFTRQAGVKRVINDVKVYALETSPAIQKPLQVLPWGVDRIDAEKAWAESTGSRVKVAVIDTGIDTGHPDLKIYGGINTINKEKSYKDDNGHGTHVAGIIAALNNRVGVIGVAHDAMLYAVKVLGADGSGNLSDIIEGLEWCINNNIQVVNMSLGTDEAEDLFHEAIKHVYNAGIFIVAAAGNSGPRDNTISYPAKYPEVAAVAASSQFDQIAFFSSRGAEVDLVAPGVNIYSTYRGRSYRKLSGTSMAAPHVAGAAALVLAKKGVMSPDKLLSHLKETSQDMHFSPDKQGAGLVDAYISVTN
ncbi:MAG: S8 family peptidase [Peptococcaceae bacterium]|nr:S8 family peptidase [Peptococcaceae bacterium]